MSKKRERKHLHIEVSPVVPLDEHLARWETELIVHDDRAVVVPRSGACRKRTCSNDAGATRREVVDLQ